MATTRQPSKNVIGGRGSNDDTISVRAMIRSDPPTAAALSKLHESTKRPEFTDKGEMKVGTPSIRHLQERAKQIASNQRDSENILATMPDIEMMAQLLISSIISPHDLITKEIVISSEFDLFNPTLKTELISKIRDYFDKDYRIKDQIHTIIENILIHDGSHPLLVLPENAIDELINGRSNYSSESLYSGGLFNKTTKALEPLGLLANPYKNNPEPDYFKTGFSLEDLDLIRTENLKSTDHSQVKIKVVTDKDEESEVSLGINVIDNFNILKIPSIISAKRDELSNNVIKKASNKTNSSFKVSFEENEISMETLPVEEKEFSTESFDQYFQHTDMSDRSIRSLVYKSRHKTNDTIRIIRTQDQLTRRSIGEPLVLKAPAESFIPVFVPGQENRQVGAFILLDSTGNFLTKDSLKDFQGSFQMNPSNQNFASSLLQRVKSNYNGNFDCSNPLHQQELTNAYVDVVEADFLARLRNLTHGSIAKISTNQEIYRIMLIRHLAGNLTQALWVPKELFTYFAFDYNNAGVGRSILDKIKVLSSIRAIVMMANVKASIRNSIGETVIDVVLDPRDPDPVKTQELIYNMIATTRQESMPIGVQNPSDITEWLAKAGIRFAWSGHSGLPDTTIQMRQEGMNYVKPDADLMEDLEKYIAKSFGLTPEQVDNIHQPDHATTIVSNNILFAKRVILYQDKFNPQLSDHCRKMCVYSQNVYESVVNTIAKNFNAIELTKELEKSAKDNPNVKKMIIELVSKDFIDSLLFELPRPKNVRIENQINEIEALETLVDKVVEYHFTDAMFDSEVFGDIAEGFADKARDTVKAFLMRKAMSDAGIMTDLVGFFTDKFNDSEFASLFAEQDLIAHNTLAAFVKHVADNVRMKKKLEKAKERLDMGDTNYTSSYEEDDEDSSSSSDDSFDFDIDENISEVESPPDIEEIEEIEEIPDQPNETDSGF
ncbi:MAG: hypothetical protein M0R77_00440 [Gammaproteobacteria bacterium]|nr:hypothetical protein [Acholeplasmataceae bacterium]MCK9529022.1 hypothetical protein [Gammaproteobacteria bacterium]